MTGKFHFMYGLLQKVVKSLQLKIVFHGIFAYRKWVFELFSWNVKLYSPFRHTDWSMCNRTALSSANKALFKAILLQKGSYLATCRITVMAVCYLEWPIECFNRCFQLVLLQYTYKYDGTQRGAVLGCEYPFETGRKHTPWRSLNCSNRLSCRQMK